MCVCMRVYVWGSGRGVACEVGNTPATEHLWEARGQTLQELVLRLRVVSEAESLLFLVSEAVSCFFPARVLAMESPVYASHLTTVSDESGYIQLILGAPRVELRVSDLDNKCFYLLRQFTSLPVLYKMGIPCVLL